MRTITSTISKETASKLKGLAKTTKRSKSFPVACAIENFIENESREISQTIDSLKQANKGELSTDTEIQEAFSRWNMKVDTS